MTESTTTPPVSATLLMTCPDRRGLVAAVTDFIFRRGGNVLHLDQHVDSRENVFFMRVEWDINSFETPRDQIEAQFRPLADQFHMTWRLHFSDTMQRMAIFVTKDDHCLYDLLARTQSGELRVEIPVIFSNHGHLEHVAQKFDIPYHKFSINKDNKREQEDKQIELLKQHQVDLVILARYMQIISPEFIAQFPNQIINIHHSFLPAFPGAKPYHQAYERGVKIIGATSHYVTVQLDEGPIIDQDVTQVDHRDTVDEMIRKGRDLEKTVLARAIWYHVHHRVLTYNNKTVVFR